MTTVTSTQYGYGHTKEAAALVRADLKATFPNEIKEYGLKISVRTPGRGHSYGGPRVEITTNDRRLEKQYEFIINSDGSGYGDGPGRLVRDPVSDYPNGRPHHTARLVTPNLLEELNAKIHAMLCHYGRDNDDAMTDYFDNTAPLFYGVQHEKEA